MQLTGTIWGKLPSQFIHTTPEKATHARTPCLHTAYSEVPRRLRLKHVSPHLENVCVHFQALLLLEQLRQRLHRRGKLLRRLVPPPGRTEVADPQAGRRCVGIDPRCRRPPPDVLLLVFRRNQMQGWGGK